MPALPAKGSTMTTTKTIPVYGRIPAHLDPFGLILGQTVPRTPFLRFEDEGGSGAGAGGTGGEGGSGSGEGAGANADKPLGEAGERALEREKERRREASAELKKFTDLGISADDIAKLVEANDPKNPERIAKQAATQATKDAETRLSTVLRTSAIREVAATSNFSDPADALAMLPADKVAALKVDLDAGTADTAGVKALLDDLAKAKPYLLKTTDTTADHRLAGIGASGGTGTAPETAPGTPTLRAAYAESAGRRK
jgi:hypothetical protein